jgi:hypothetical protein
MEFCYCVYDTNPDVSGILVVPPASANYYVSKRLKFGEVNLSHK